ncbi:MAG: hypothetical protein MUC87_14190 [Bacteroidia bacterium]|jgi:hypothetical protein|nr:hypothetical protein [Bacteroidia bacterium]
MKRNVQFDRQKPGSDEILSRRNFDALLDQYNQQAGKVVKMPSSRRYVWVATAAAAVTLLAVVFFYTDDSLNKGKNNNGLANKTPVTKDTLTNVADAAPVPVPAYNTLRADAARQTVVEAGNGVRITLPANALADASGAPVSGEVELRYRRLADPVDLFLSDIPMGTQNGSTTEAYESAEMVEMLAFQNGQPLALRKGQTIDVELPAVSGFSPYSLETATASWIPVQSNENTAAVNNQLLAIEDLSPQRRAEYDALLEEQRMEEYRITAPLLPALPAQPRAADPKKNRFNVDFKAGEFPEMTDWKNVVFEVDESARRFNASVYEVQWENVTLVRSNREGYYQIRLEKGLRAEKIDVYPVLEGDALKAAQDEYNAAAEKRQQILGNQQTQLNTLRARIAEKCNALRRADTNAPQNNEAAAGKKTFRSGHLGIFATLRKIAWPSSVRTASLMLNGPDGKAINASRIIHVQQGINSIFKWNGNPAAGFSYNAGAKNQLWVIADGKLWWAASEAFTPAASDLRITLKPVPAQAAANAGTLRNYFAL